VARAEERLRAERALLAAQGLSSRWRPVFERAVKTHERAAQFQAEALSLLLTARALQDQYEEQVKADASRTVHRAASR
jgi:hypothetical protein